MSTFDPVAEAEKVCRRCEHKKLTAAALQRAFSAGLAAGLERAEEIARGLDEEMCRGDFTAAIASERERTRGTPG